MATKHPLKKNMDNLIKLFGVNGNDMKTSIITYLILSGWERSKATDYAVLVEEYAKTKDRITSIWPGE